MQLGWNASSNGRDHYQWLGKSYMFTFVTKNSLVLEGSCFNTQFPLQSRAAPRESMSGVQAAHVSETMCRQIGSMQFIMIRVQPPASSMGRATSLRGGDSHLSGMIGYQAVWISFRFWGWVRWHSGWWSLIVCVTICGDNLLYSIIHLLLLPGFPLTFTISIIFLADCYWYTVWWLPLSMSFIFTLPTNTSLLRWSPVILSCHPICHPSLLFQDLPLTGPCRQYNTINTVLFCTCISKLELCSAVNLVLLCLFCLVLPST